MLIDLERNYKVQNRKGVKVAKPFGSILYLIHTIRSKDTHDRITGKRGSTRFYEDRLVYDWCMTDNYARTKPHVWKKRNSKNIYMHIHG